MKSMGAKNFQKKFYGLCHSLISGADTQLARRVGDQCPGDNHGCTHCHTALGEILLYSVFQQFCLLSSSLKPVKLVVGKSILCKSLLEQKWSNFKSKRAKRKLKDGDGSGFVLRQESDQTIIRKLSKFRELAGKTTGGLGFAQNVSKLL